MRKHILPGIIAVAAVFLASNAQGIPPPWSIELMKAERASVIVIGQINQVVAVEGEVDLVREAGVSVVKCFRGNEPDLAQTGPEELNYRVMFAVAAAEKSAAELQAVSVGSPGLPNIRAGDVALVFLKEDLDLAGVYRVVLGSFGYIRLNTDSKTERAACKETIQRYLAWCERIRDTSVRKTMTAIYRETLGFVLDRSASLPADSD